MPAHQHILVIGGGIIGASIALHLLRAGARVTLIDAGEPGGVATRNSFAWVNPTWSGSLNWELPPDRLQRFFADHASWGYDVREVRREEALRLEPTLANPPDLAIHCPAEGAIEPLAAVRAILAAVTGLGGIVIS